MCTLQACHLRLTGFLPDQPSHRTYQSSRETPSKSAVSFLRSKLNTCLATHTNCRRHIDATSPRYPTRLLSLTCRSRSKVALVDTDDNTHGDYFSLSHCWGGLQPLRLTHRSEQSLRDGVEISNLPKTFQDAIKLCRQLDIAYIWIDSMCIFQDDLGDWHSQAAQMRQVYASALCNIAATGARNGSYGLYFDRDEKAMEQFLILAPRHFWHGGDKQPVVQYTVCFNGGYEFFVRNGTLNTRSWVLQERFLSRRIMHFTTSGVFWECLTNLSNDLYPDRLPQTTTNLATRDVKLKRSLLQSGYASTHHMQWTPELYEGWNMLCEKYAECHLTVESDKLVALTGISQK
jgi:hypothetical protein